MMEARLMTTAPAQCQDEVTTIVIDEVHNRSAHSDYVLALTLAVMQKTPDVRLVLMSATGDHHWCGSASRIAKIVHEGSNAPN